MALTMLAFGLVIILSEGVLWFCFRRKVGDMQFPSSMDTSSLRFFSMAKMVLLVIVHTAFLLITTLIPLWILW